MLANTQKNNSPSGENSADDRRNPSPKICACGCGRPIKPDRRGRNFAYLPWHLVSPANVITCQGCGITFSCARSHDRKFCSRGCAGLHRKPRARIRKYVSVTCPCGEVSTFAAYKNAKYCNRECCNKFKPKFRGKRRRQLRANCELCGKDYGVIPNSNQGRNRFCSLECYRDYRISGLSGEVSSHPHTQRKRLMVLRGPKCEDCGFNAVPEILQIHHLDRNRRNGSHDNVLLLCPNCHAIRHFKDGTGWWDAHKRSEEHKRINQQKLQCQHCGKEFTKRYSGPNRFCSYACNNKHRHPINPHRDSATIAPRTVRTDTCCSPKGSFS